MKTWKYKNFIATDDFNSERTNNYLEKFCASCNLKNFSSKCSPWRKFKYISSKEPNTHVPINEKRNQSDINCRLKAKFNDENQKDIFFSSFDDLQDIADMEI